jgi:HSP20 family protein
MTRYNNNFGLPSLPSLPSLRSEVEEFFGDVLGRSQARSASASWLPSLDLIEEPGVFIVELDMPGMRLQDLSIVVSGRRLTLSGRREIVRDLSSARIRVRERWSGSFSRSIELPGSVDENRVTATLHEGILRISLPRRRTLP